MLMNASGLRGYKIAGADGETGTVMDLLFSDQDWKICWVVVASRWLQRHPVLLAWWFLKRPEMIHHKLPVTLTVQQIKSSPHPYRDPPVSQYRELARRRHQDWWSRLQNFWRPVTLNIDITGENDRAGANMMDPVRAGGDPHLRSMQMIRGFGIRATDGELGRVEDFLIDEAAWSIRYIKGNTRRSWFGRRVLISPFAVEKISLDEKLVYFNLSCQEIRDGLLYDPSATRF